MRLRRSLSITLTLMGLVTALVAVGAVHLIDRPLWHNREVAFLDPAGERLVGTVYPGSKPVGAILLAGFGGDQVAMRSLAREFAAAGFAVMTFDFSGHGRSPGGLTFDNAATDRLSRQVMAARAFFRRQLSPQAPIFLVGHSLGGRVALQSALSDPQDLGGLVLLGPQVNLATNTQAEFFTGTSDADLNWVQALGPESPALPLLVITGAWDDVITPHAAGLLMAQLSTTPAALPKAPGSSFTQHGGRQWVLIPRLTHNFETVSPQAVGAAVGWAAQVSGKTQASPLTARRASVRILGWAAGLLGGLAALAGGIGWTGSDAPRSPNAPIEITRLGRFLWAKLAMWLAALPCVALMFAFVVFLPFNYPAFNLIYFGFLSGYGLLNLLLYRLGRMPGTAGSLPFGRRAGAQLPRNRLLAALGLGVLTLAFTAAFARTGWFYVFPLNARLLWLVVFTLVTAPGFWSGIYETDMVARAAPGRIAPLLGLVLIGLAPFILWSAFLGGLGSLSGLIGGLEGLLILTLALLFGRLVLQVSGRPWLAALWQAALVFWLILPLGPLFAPGF